MKRILPFAALVSTADASMASHHGSRAPRPSMASYMAHMNNKTRPSSSCSSPVVCSASASLCTSFDSDGNVCSLRDGERELIAPVPTLALFYITFSSGAGSASHSSASFGNAQCVMGSVPPPGPTPLSSLSLAFNCTYGIVTASVAGDETAGDALQWSVTVTSVNPAWAVAEVMYPQLSLHAPAGVNDTTPGSDRLMLCGGDGALLVEPTAYGFLTDFDYPGSCGVQLQTRYDNVSGLYVATHDATAQKKQFISWSHPGAYLQMFPALVPPETPGADAVFPYNVTIMRYTGDWRDAAAMYGSWARSQPFATEGGRATNTTRVPSWLINGTALMMVQVQNDTGFMPDVLGPTLQDAPSVSSAYHDYLGVNHFALLPMGWEKDGSWAGIEYFPSVPSDDAWAAASSALAANGDVTGVMISGFWWVTQRNVTQWGPAFNNSADVPASQCALTIAANGSAWYEDAYNETTNGDLWRGISYRLCHGEVTRAQGLIASAFTGVANRMGAALASFDQEIGGGQSTPCYNASHGHAMGQGPWMHEGFAATVAAIRANASSLALCAEQTGELLLPLLSTVHTYQTAVMGWPWGAVAGTGVPLFSSIYHPLMPTIGIPAGQTGNDNIPDTVFIVRQNFVNALVWGLLLETGNYFVYPPALGSQDPLQAGLTPAFAAASAAHTSFAGLLLLGEMTQPPVVTSTSTPSNTFPTSVTCSGDPPTQAGNGMFTSLPPSGTNYLAPLCSVSVGAFQLTTSDVAEAASFVSPLVRAVLNATAAARVAVAASIASSSSQYLITLDSWASPEQVVRTLLLAGNGSVLKSWQGVPPGELQVDMPALGVHVWLLQ